MTCGIYQLYHIPSKSVAYVGSSVDIERRLHVHLTDLGRGIHHNSLLQALYDQRSDCLLPEIVEVVQRDRNALLEREIYWIKYCKSTCNMIDPRGGPRLLSKPAKKAVVARRAALDVDEPARRWSVHPDTVRKMIKAGQLASFRVGRVIRIRTDVIETYEQAGGQHEAASA